MLRNTSGTRGKHSRGCELIDVRLKRQKQCLKGGKPITNTCLVKGVRWLAERIFPKTVTSSDEPVEPSSHVVAFNRWRILVGVYKGRFGLRRYRRRLRIWKGVYILVCGG